MGILADSLFTVLMGWMRGLVNALWALLAPGRTTALEFLGKNWLLIAVIIVAAGLMIDWIVWLLRWQPYHLWAQRVRRLLGIEEPEEERQPARARAAAAPVRKETRRENQEQPDDRWLSDDWLDNEWYADGEGTEGDTARHEAIQRAQAAPDEYAYPGMRFDSKPEKNMNDTQRYSAVTQEGPGAREVARRQGEIAAWQLQMQEETRARAQAERAAQESQDGDEAAQAAYEAEQARLAQEAQAAYEAEQARLAQEAQAAYEAEQARLAQEEYERQLAEYERQKAEYEIAMAEYERQKAAYEAQLAAGTAQHTALSYGDYVDGEEIDDLPDAPAWPQMENAPVRKASVQGRKSAQQNKLFERVARMIEPEEEELAVRTKLPPRVNVKDAYKPAAAPDKTGRRGRNA